MSYIVATTSKENLPRCGKKFKDFYTLKKDGTWKRVWKAEKVVSIEEKGENFFKVETTKHIYMLSSQ